MAIIKKTQIRPEDGNDYETILYPETSADMVIDEATGKTLATHLTETASLTKKGHVQLSSTISTDETKAATPKLVKQAYDAATNDGIISGTTTNTAYLIMMGWGLA